MREKLQQSSLEDLDPKRGSSVEQVPDQLFCFSILKVLFDTSITASHLFKPQQAWWKSLNSESPERALEHLWPEVLLSWGCFTRYEGDLPCIPSGANTVVCSQSHSRTNALCSRLPRWPPHPLPLLSFCFLSGSLSLSPRSWYSHMFNGINTLPRQAEGNERNGQKSGGGWSHGRNGGGGGGWSQVRGKREPLKRMYSGKKAGWF